LRATVARRFDARFVYEFDRARFWGLRLGAAALLGLLGTGAAAPRARRAERRKVGLPPLQGEDGTGKEAKEARECKDASEARPSRPISGGIVSSGKRECRLVDMRWRSEGTETEKLRRPSRSGDEMLPVCEPFIVVR
jgi:hypothetical protein